MEIEERPEPRGPPAFRNHKGGARKETLNLWLPEFPVYPNTPTVLCGALIDDELLVTTQGSPQEWGLKSNVFYLCRQSLCAVHFLTIPNFLKEQAPGGHVATSFLKHWTCELVKNSSTNSKLVHGDE